MESHSISNWLGNVISTGAVVATITGYVPGIAAFVALVWYFIQIFESATVQRWLAGRRIRKLARMKAAVIMLEARDRASPVAASKPDEPGLPPGYGS